MSAPAVDSLKQAAHEYAQLGWHVIPLHHVDDIGVCSCRTGAVCPSAGKHPVPKGWQHRASCSGADIEAWWDEYPRANVGIATGIASGLFVLDVDVDPEKYGPATLAALEAQHGTLPSTRTIRTGSGGKQLYFAWPGFEIHNSASTALGPKPCS